MNDSFAADFEAKSKVFAALAGTNQFQPKTFERVSDFAQSMRAHSAVKVWEKRKVDIKTGHNLGWTLSFDVHHFETIDHQGRKHSHLNFARFSALLR